MQWLILPAARLFSPDEYDMTADQSLQISIDCWPQERAQSCATYPRKEHPENQEADLVQLHACPYPEG